MSVFSCVYQGLKEGYSFRQIIGLIATLDHFMVPVGNINHCYGTSEKNKECYSKMLKKRCCYSNEAEY